MADFILDDEDLAELQDVITISSPDPAVIKRPTVTKTAQGGNVRSSYTVVATVMGRLQPVDHKTTEQERIIANKFQGRALYRIQLPFDVDVRLEDQVFIDGHTIEIVSVSDNAGFTVRQHPVGVEIN